MQDIKLYLEKLRTDATDCLTISDAAASEAKREVFKLLAATYQRLAVDLEKIITANAILDGERDKHLLGLLGSGGDSVERLDELAKLLGQQSGE